MSNNPNYRGREYYYQDQHTENKINELQTRNYTEEYQYTTNEARPVHPRQYDTNALVVSANEPSAPQPQNTPWWAGALGK